MNKTLTVFTPAYNRAHTLGRTYDSLCRQTCKDFKWLIVDDGSTDGTRQLVNGWIADDKIEISYIYQENQGMHGAHNTAYKHIDTELNTCIDSDDWMPDDAVEKIVSFWKKNGSEKYAGIVGIDVKSDGTIIGDMFKEDEKITTLDGFYARGGSGDKKLVYRTDVVKQYPVYPLFSGEHYVSLGTLYLMIDQNYNLLSMNCPLVVVDYQEDGSSMNMFKQYWNNPNGFIYSRKLDMKYRKGFKREFRTCIHYIAECRIAHVKHVLSDTILPVKTFLAYPFGIALYYYIKYQVRHNNRLNIK